MPPLTLGQAVAGKARLIVRCKSCLRRFEADTAELSELAGQHGATTTMAAWVSRLRCSECVAHNADFVVNEGKALDR